MNIPRTTTQPIANYHVSVGFSTCMCLVYCEIHNNTGAAPFVYQCHSYEMWKVHEALKNRTDIPDAPRLAAIRELEFAEAQYHRHLEQINEAVDVHFTDQTKRVISITAPEPAPLNGLGWTILAAAAIGVCWLTATTIAALAESWF